MAMTRAAQDTPLAKEEVAIVYITASSSQEAEKISAALLENRLVACVNILPGITSYYWWQGKLEKSAEIIILAKTKRSLADTVIDKVKSIHSYECPCIMLLPVESGNPAFLEWIASTTKPAL